MIAEQAFFYKLLGVGKPDATGWVPARDALAVPQELVDGSIGRSYETTGRDSLDGRWVSWKTVWCASRSSASDQKSAAVL